MQTSSLTLLCGEVFDTQFRRVPIFIWHAQPITNKCDLRLEGTKKFVYFSQSVQEPVSI